MPDIHHDFPIAASREKVFELLSSPEGLAKWWTLDSDGTPGEGEVYQLGFGPGYAWEGVLRVYDPPTRIVWELTTADPDWLGTRVGFELEEVPAGTQVRFTHSGWPEANEHYRTSNMCWAMYLRILRRHIEFGEVVPYLERLSV
jgi:uncharacterized protein YndB with AHSA1/START domain